MINYLKSLFSAKEVKATARVPYLPISGGYSAQWSESSFQATVDEAYKKNDIVYAAVSAISGSALEAPIMGMNDQNEMVDSFGIQLIENPNPHQSFSEFLERLLIHSVLSGGFFVHKEKDGFGRVSALYLLDPSHVRVISDPFVMKSGYIYDITGQQKRLELNEVIHGIVFPDPVSPIDSLSPLTAAFRQIDTDNEATNHIKFLLENRGVPGIVLTTDDVLPPDYLERLKAMIDAGYSGKKRGSAMVLEGGLKPAQLGLTPADMDYATLRQELEARICSVLGVPPILIGAKVGLDRSTFANFEEARKVFWQDTICPLLKKVASILERDPDLNPEKLHFHFDYSDTPAMHSVGKEYHDKVLIEYQVGLLTMDEARAELGYEEMDTVEMETEAEMEDIPEENKDLQKCSCGHTHEVKEKKTEQRPLRLLRSVMGRRNIADKEYPHLRRIVKGLLKEQKEDIIAIVDQAASEKAIVNWAVFKFAMSKLKGKWAERANEQINPSMAKIVGTAAKQTASSELGIDFDIDRPQVIEAMNQSSFKFAESFSNTSSDIFKSIFEKAEKEGRSLAELKQDLLDTVDGMTASRAEMIARTETMRAANGGARMAYKEAGVTKLQWLTADDDVCAYCQSLDGVTVGVDEPFIKQGEYFQPEGASVLNTTYSDVRGGDAHPNCRCTIVPVVE